MYDAIGTDIEKKYELVNWTQPVGLYNFFNNNN